MKKILISILGIFLVALLSLGVFFFTRKGDYFKPWIEDQLTESLGRRVSLAGPLTIDWSMSPQLRVNGLELANANWGSKEAFLRVESGLISVPLWPLLGQEFIIEQLELKGANLLLQTNEQGSGNWEFEGLQSEAEAVEEDTDSEPAPCLELPDIRQLSIRGSQIQLPDGRVFAIEKLKGVSSGPGSKVSLSSTTSVEQAELVLEAEVIPKGRAADLKFSLESELASASFEAGLKPSGTKCFFSSEFSLKGEHLDDLNSILSTSLPELGPYQAQGRYLQRASGFLLEKTFLKLGESDFSGEFEYVEAGEKSSMRLNGKSLLFRVEDVSPGDDSKADLDKQESAKEEEFLFSREEVPWASLVSLPWELDLSFDRFVQGASLVVDKLALSGKASKEAVAIDLKQAELFSGRMKGVLKISQPLSEPVLDLSLDAAGIELGTALDQKETLEGKADFQLKLKSRGKSPHELAKSAEGAFDLFAGKGRFENSIISLLTGSLYDILHPIFGDEGANALHCIVAGFDIDKGVAKSRTMLFSASLLGLSGEGDIDLGKEELSLGFSMKSDEPSIASLLIPFRITGDIDDPSVLPDLINTGKELILAPKGITEQVVKNVGQAVESVSGLELVSGADSLCQEAIKKSKLEKSSLSLVTDRKTSSSLN